MPARSLIVRVLLGILLLTAAGLKLYGLSASAVPRVGWFAQPWVQLLAAEWELVLGAWLLSGVYPRVSWLAALVTFVTFAGVSGYLGWVGVASCGCLGAIKISPWWACGADVIAVAALAVSRPREGWSAPPRFNTAGSWAASVALVCAALVGTGTLYFGSLEAAVANLRGDALSATPHVDFGTGKPGDSLEATVTVTNWTNQPIRVIGGTSDCSCTAIGELPVTVPPHGSRAITMRLTIPPTQSGAFARAALLWTDAEKQPTIRFRLGCRVVD